MMVLWLPLTKIIVDLRDNVGGNIDYAVAVCNLLVSKRTMFISYDKKKSCAVYKSDLINKPFDEITVLTNGKTASAAEAVALSLQDDGNIIIGEKTYGKGVAQKKYYIYGGAVLNITIKEFYRASGDSINNKGVYPNIMVECVNANCSDKIIERAYLYITNGVK